MNPRTLPSFKWWIYWAREKSDISSKAILWWPHRYNVLSNWNFWIFSKSRSHLCWNLMQLESRTTSRRHSVDHNCNCVLIATLLSVVASRDITRSTLMRWSNHKVFIGALRRIVKSCWSYDTHRDSALHEMKKIFFINRKSNCEDKFVIEMKSNQFSVVRKFVKLNEISIYIAEIVKTSRWSLIVRLWLLRWSIHWWVIVVSRGSVVIVTILPACAQ